MSVILIMGCIACMEANDPRTTRDRPATDLRETREKVAARKREEKAGFSE